MEILILPKSPAKRYRIISSISMTKLVREISQKSTKLIMKLQVFIGLLRLNCRHQDYRA